MTLQQQIIKALGAKPQINAEEEIRRSVDFLKSYLQTYPFIKSLVLGISGFFSIKLPSSTIICQPDTPQALTCFHALGNLRNQHDFFCG